MMVPYLGARWWQSNRASRAIHRTAVVSQVLDFAGSMFRHFLDWKPYPTTDPNKQTKFEEKLGNGRCVQRRDFDWHTRISVIFPDWSDSSFTLRWNLIVKWLSRCFLVIALAPSGVELSADHANLLDSVFSYCLGCDICHSSASRSSRANFYIHNGDVCGSLSCSVRTRAITALTAKEGHANYIRKW